ncbi:yjr100c-like protein, partial [Ramicandelaber brevisporus]
PVVIPQSTSAIIQPDSPSSALLIQPALVIQRQIELMNVMIGFEQANKYAVCDAAGTTLGYIAEEDHSFAKSMTRQLLRTHRPFKAYVVDTSGRVVLKIERPFTLINSQMRNNALEGMAEVLIGEIHQIWHPWRRKYELFVGDTQFASIDAPLLSWNFDLQDEHGRTIGSVDKQFTAWLREIFTDTSAYVLRLDAAQQPGHLETPLENQVNATGGGEGSIATRGLTLDERAVLLASAMTIDTDYFSRHSNSSGIVSPMFM